MTTLDDKVLSYCRIYFTQDKLYAGQFTNEWMLGKIEGLEQDMPENGWTYSFWGTPHEENYGDYHREPAGHELLLPGQIADRFQSGGWCDRHGS